MIWATRQGREEVLCTTCGRLIGERTLHVISVTRRYCGDCAVERAVRKLNEKKEITHWERNELKTRTSGLR